MTGDGRLPLYCNSSTIRGTPQITVAIPSLNQGRFIEDAIESILDQDVDVEIFVVDGGSTDNTVEILRSRESQIRGWRSRTDRGQAAAINEAISCGSAPMVCWLNSDDRYLPGGLSHLVEALQCASSAPAAYGMVLNERKGRQRPIPVEPFSRDRLARRCIISQPGTLIRREAWNAVGGLGEHLVMALDYDLWWRLYRQFGPLEFVSKFVAVNRDHPDTKTNRLRKLHYREAMDVVRIYSGSVPVAWWLKIPYSVWYRGAKAFVGQRWKGFR